MGNVFMSSSESHGLWAMVNVFVSAERPYLFNPHGSQMRSGFYDQDEALAESRESERCRSLIVIGRSNEEE